MSLVKKSYPGRHLPTISGLCPIHLWLVTSDFVGFGSHRYVKQPSLPHFFVGGLGFRV